ncbi:hypothetical protein NQ317_001676 [Molorchus minor]|uniref:Single-stranded DNA-binding protein n=1 Tax=Molorchus minor TaxID=1323400 RepID=A0ABQ9JHU0_9CUCU|nr:hypothetical protein NQ317_001676 [Molorchus minor]
MISSKFFRSHSLTQTAKRNILLHVSRNSSSTSTQQEPPRIEKTINTVTLLGRVGADPQKKGTEDHPIAVFFLSHTFKLSLRIW